MLMVSHIDLDHINGVLKLTEALAEGSGREAAAAVRHPDAVAQQLRRSRGIGRATALSHGAAVGRRIRRTGRDRGRRQGRTPAAPGCRRPGDQHESGFDALIQFDTKAKPLKIGGKLTFTVVGPRKPQLDKLKQDWKDKIGPILEKEKQKEAALAEAPSRTPRFPICRASWSWPPSANAGAQKTILLTGDARGGYIVDSLREANCSTPAARSRWTC
jgi:hypothetical protein